MNFVAELAVLLGTHSFPRPAQTHAFCWLFVQKPTLLPETARLALHEVDAVPCLRLGTWRWFTLVAALDGLVFGARLLLATAAGTWLRPTGVAGASFTFRTFALALLRQVRRL